MGIRCTRAALGMVQYCHRYIFILAVRFTKVHIIHMRIVVRFFSRWCHFFRWRTGTNVKTARIDFVKGFATKPTTILFSFYSPFTHTQHDVIVYAYG